MVGGVPSRPLILIAAPDGLHPALARLTSGPQYRTMVVHTGENVLRALYKYRPDGLILSLRLPGLDPWEVLSRVRDMSDLPIAVVDLTYRVADAARALEAGADDYLTAELPDRLHLPLLRARLRRATADAPPGTAPVVEDGLLTLDLGTHEAVLSGHRLDLTPIEFDLLLTLARHPGQVLSADRLLRTVWDVPAGSDASRVKYTVLRLRRKIARTTGEPAPIETVRGVGYRYPRRPVRSGPAGTEVRPGPGQEDPPSGGPRGYKVPDPGPHRRGPAPPHPGCNPRTPVLPPPSSSLGLPHQAGTARRNREHPCTAHCPPVPSPWSWAPGPSW